MATTSKPRLVILAGPNGAGKTTSAKFLLRDSLKLREFVNADTVAAGLSGFAPETVAIEAGRIILKRIATLIEQRTSFAFETTLSSKSLTRILERATKAGYQIDLIYLALPSAAIAIERVAARVILGGHDIPKATVVRRFHRSLTQLVTTYIPLVNRWKVFDNYHIPPELIATGNRRKTTIVVEQKWQTLNALARTPQAQ
jgi:predicted ABC-type ATPase